MRNTLATILIILGAAAPVLAAEQASGTPGPGPLTISSAADPARPLEDWGTRSLIEQTADRRGRPSALPPLYISLAALNALDIYSTNRALARGARELNPVMAATRNHLGAVLAVKGATTASSILLTERFGKKHRAAAVTAMVALNGVTAIVAARNLRNAR